MKNFWKVFWVMVAVVGIGIGYWLISPLFLDKKISETMDDIGTMVPANSTQVVIAHGNFVDADNFHKGEGKVKLIRSGDKYFSEARICALKGNIGGQNYEVPVGINPDNYNEVWVWCRAFSVPFSSVILR